MRYKSSFFAVLISTSVLLPPFGFARTLLVGATRELKAPSDAALLANDGDSVLIDQGQYIDCAIWRANHLTIEGNGNVTVRDRVCQDKAIFVISGSDVTIRGVEFANARSTNKNGAGIRGEGTNLTIENSRFIDNEDGILTGPNRKSRIVIRDSVFTRNGKCNSDCATKSASVQSALWRFLIRLFFNNIPATISSHAHCAPRSSTIASWTGLLGLPVMRSISPTVDP